MKTTILAAGLALALAGCASIISGGTQPVTIKSVPEGAAVSVTNRAGEKIHAGTTPATLTLKRGAGYFKSEVYTVAIQKEGYAPQNLTITGFRTFRELHVDRLTRVNLFVGTNNAGKTSILEAAEVLTIGMARGLFESPLRRGRDIGSRHQSG